jgi:hypothetical protein
MIQKLTLFSTENMYNWGWQVFPLLGDAEPSKLQDNIALTIGVVCFGLFIIIGYIRYCYEDAKFKKEHPEAWAIKEIAEAQKTKASGIGCLVVVIIIVAIAIVLF